MISLQTLKTRSLKKRSDAELFVDRFFARRVSIYVTWLLVHTPFSANQVTVASMLLMIAGTAWLAVNTWWAPAAGAALMLIGYVLDCCDGEIARFRSQTSLRGVYLDTLAHAITIPAMFAGLGIGQMLRHGTVESLALGIIAAIAATNPARAAFAALAGKTGTAADQVNAKPAPANPTKAFYLKTIARILIFPNSMFVICAAALADSLLLREARHGAIYTVVAFYGVFLALEQIAAAVSWSREERLKQGGQ